MPEVPALGLLDCCVQAGVVGGGIMPTPGEDRLKEITEEDIRLIARRLKKVKEAGWGNVTIKVTDGKIVLIEHTVGEQIKAEGRG